MFNKKMLIELSGVSKATFYRRLQVLRNQNLLPDGDKGYMDLDRAKQIAGCMGFLPLLENHLNKQQK